MKSNMINWIIGIGGGQRQYKVGNVTYMVSSHFQPTEAKDTIKDRIKRTLVSDFVPLTILNSEDKMADEYVCSTAGEEENNAVEKEN